MSIGKSPLARKRAMTHSAAALYSGDAVRRRSPCPVRETHQVVGRLSLLERLVLDTVNDAQVDGVLRIQTCSGKKYGKGA